MRSCAGKQEYHLTDSLGSTTGLTDETGDLVVSYGYNVFGAIRAQTGTQPNEFTFTGEQVDSSGLQYLRARYYDNATGRFLVRDPLPLLQRYPYVGDNPVNFADPTGLCKWYLASADELPDPADVIDAVQCAVDVRCVAEKGVGLLPPGQFTIPIIDATVSLQEAATCAIYPAQCALVFALAANAERETHRIHGSPREGTFAQPSPGDAFEHCFWSGSITLALGGDSAAMWTTRHEAMAGNPPGQKSYDLYNNGRGRAFGESLRPGFGPLEIPNPFGLSNLRSLCKE